MCQKQTILALDSAGRYIAQWEHGTIHIIWGNLSIRLCPVDFAQFAGMVENAQAQAFDPSGADSAFRLRMRGVLLEFSAEDLELLEELNCLASMQIGHPEVTREINLFDLPEIDSICAQESSSPCSLN